MQSSQFDISAYHGAIYGSATGYETGNFRFHHSGYTGDSDVSCYSSYISPGAQNVQGYGCREPPAYPDASTFYYPSGAASNFDNSNSYKIQNGQTRVTDCNNVTTMTRQQDNFLIKPHDSLMLSHLQDTRDSSNRNNTMCNSSHNSQHQHNHYQQLPQHLKHQRSFNNAHEIMLAAKHVPEDVTVFSHTSVKMESHELESSHSHTQFDETVTTTTTDLVPTIPISLQQEFKTTTHNATKSDDQINCISPTQTESKTLLPQNSSEALLDKDIVDEKTEEEAGESKPTMSYIALIAKAILESEHKRLNLGSIYNWIESHYPFYKNKGQGWRNSVRHNLSLNDCFIKAGRCEDGKGNYWAIHPANIQDFVRGDFRQRRRSRRRGRKKDCDMNMYHTPTGYLQSQSSSLTPGMTFNPTALSSIYSPYTEAERRAYRLDEALLRQSVNNPFVKWYQQGVTTPGYGVSASPPACSSGIYTSPNSLQWPQAYGDSNSQTMYQGLSSSFSR